MAGPTRIEDKKVLHILDQSLPNIMGYTIRSKYIIELQSELGLSPIVVSSPKYPRSIKYEEINGIPYYRSYAPTRGFDRVLMSIPFVREHRIIKKLEETIAQIVDSLGVDIIHAHSPSLCGIPALRVAERKSLPFIYEVRALWEDAAVDRGRFKEQSLRYKISRTIEQKIFRKADAIIPICQGLKNEIERRVRIDKEIHVVPNGVDVKMFHPKEKTRQLLEKYKLDQRIVVVGFIGSFFKFEGLEDLIASIKLIMERDNQFFFLIVGGGVEEMCVKKLATEMGLLKNAVDFAGIVPHEHIQDYYSVMDILVYPRLSKRITELVTPLKPLEAMAMEKVVVASAVGGMKELVEDGKTGVLYEPGNTEDLATTILRLGKDANKRRFLAKNARLHMQSTRDWSQIVPKYLDIYDCVLKAKRSTV